MFGPIRVRYFKAVTNDMVTKTQLGNTAQSARHLSVLIVRFSKSEVAFLGPSKIQQLLVTRMIKEQNLISNPKKTNFEKNLSLCLYSGNISNINKVNDLGKENCAILYSISILGSVE